MYPLTALALFAGPLPAAGPPSPRLELVGGVTRIWDAGRHNAFAMLLLFDRDVPAAEVEQAAAEDVKAFAAFVAHSPNAQPFEAPSGAVVAVRVRAAVTHTIGGLRIDGQARVLREDGRGTSKGQREDRRPVRVPCGTPVPSYVHPEQEYP